MIEIVDKKNCCGCTACSSICPINAIKMKEDEEGFLYPNVDLSICVNCHLCEHVCPYLNDFRPNEDLELVYACRSKNEDLRKISSSGGMFAEFARAILAQNGIVFGSAFDTDWKAYHIEVNDIRNLSDIMGSKYMQSILGDTFNKVKSYLDNGKLVLFVGTTCQVNGLKNYLKKDYDNLYIIDFICLGVPSPKIWKDYLDTFFSDVKISHINFKEKSLGWHTFSLNIKGDKFEYCENGRNTYFYTGYFRHYYTRPSCFNCVYKLGNRMSDITISDCWGAEEIAPELDDNKGLSSLICHSKKGKQLFDLIRSNIFWKESRIDSIMKYNSGYRNCIKYSYFRDNFWKDYEKMPKFKLFKKYCTPENKNLWHIKLWHKFLKKVYRIMIRRNI